MNSSTKFLLDSGDPDEYRQIAQLSKDKGSELWGATTNPSLIAKKLAGKKVSIQEAFKLQKEIVMEILEIVPGAVSAEVYADQQTTSEQMIEQGRDIVTWHERIYVKLPTTLQGFKAREALRKAKVPINNTLVFSQEQIFAICLHEKLCQANYGPIENIWPPFISPFVGRLDDRGENGMDLVRNGMHIKQTFEYPLWMLEASVRTVEHMKEGIDIASEIITAPAKIYSEWFQLSDEDRKNLDSKHYQTNLKPISRWNVPDELGHVDSFEGFYKAIEAGILNITHELTDKGLVRFAEDWNGIID